MISLDKILSELKPGSLNEIVAGCGGGGGAKGRSGKNAHKQRSGAKRRSGSGGSSRSSKSGYTCGCSTPPVAVVLT